jgi:RNA ligase (TIGR02306 family)
MADFVVLVRRLAEVLPHENADRLEIGRVDGYEFIIGKDQYLPGQLGVYIPEGAIVPEDILEELGYRNGTTNYLAGKDGNRVKAIRLRGHLSQGLFYVPKDLELVEGQDVAEALNITKYEPPIPLNMAGEVEPVPYGVLWPHFDVEDIKRYPDAFVPGEPVVANEKAHGSYGLFVYSQGTLYVSSKGLASQQLCLKEETHFNVYWRVVDQEGLYGKMKAFCERHGLLELALLGEVLGVQDLMYGLKPGKLDLYAFGLLTNKGFYNVDEFYAKAKELGVKTVPEVYRGPYDHKILTALAVGRTLINGATHMREGLVVLPVAERYDGRLGRVMAKYISPDYLLRKNATEFN